MNFFAIPSPDHDNWYQSDQSSACDSQIAAGILNPTGVPAIHEFGAPFSGGDPYEFIGGYEEFFKVNPMSEVDMIQYVMQDFEGEALEWYFGYVEENFLDTWTPDCWEDFIIKLYGRFAEDVDDVKGKSVATDFGDEAGESTVHEDHQTIQLDDGLINSKVGVHEIFPAKFEEPRPPINQACNESNLDKKVVNAYKVFDKISEQMGYITSLNPYPPDDYNQHTNGGTREQLEPEHLRLKNFKNIEASNFKGITIVPMLVPNRGIIMISGMSTHVQDLGMLGRGSREEMGTYAKNPVIMVGVGILERKDKDAILSVVEAWVGKLKWKGLKTLLSIDRIPLYRDDDKITKRFTKSFKNLHLYGILKAGLFIPVNELCIVLDMVASISRFPVATKGLVNANFIFPPHITSIYPSASFFSYALVINGFGRRVFIDSALPWDIFLQKLRFTLIDSHDGSHDLEFWCVARIKMKELCLLRIDGRRNDQNCSIKLVWKVNALSLSPSIFIIVVGLKNFSGQLKSYNDDEHDNLPDG